MPSPSLEPFNTPAWLSPKQHNREFRIPERLLWGILFSLIFHAFLFWGFLLDLINPSQPPASAPLNVVLNLDVPAKQPPDALPPPPEPPKPVVEPKVKPRQPQKPLTPPKVIQSDNRNSPFKVPDSTPQPPAELPAPPMPKPPVEDFSSMIKRRQTDRFANEMDARRQNEAAAAAERGPSEDERRMKNILNNLKVGTNGLFEIRRMDPFNASFSFKGWTTDYASAHTQYYEVEAKSGEDIRLMLVRRIIGLIRDHYSGDFDWVSHRLSRTVTLSARPADSAGLEDFLMREFFGPNYKTQDGLRY